MRWTEYQFCCGLKQDDRLITVPWFAYLNERVDDSNVRTGIEHFVEIGLSVDKFQLVELLIVLVERDRATSQVRQSFGHPHLH